MTELTLLDALIILFVLLRMTRIRQAELGESLHQLIALLLIVALFLGMRLGAQMRDLVSGVAGIFESVPGLGSRILIILLAWYLMRLIRTRLGHALESIIPIRAHRPITWVSETARALLLAGFIVWIIEPWLGDDAPNSSQAVKVIRAADQWIAERFRPAPTPLIELPDDEGFFQH